MVDAQLSTRLEDSIKKTFRSYTIEFEKKAQDERKRYIDLVEKSMKDIIIDEVKSQLPHILLKEVSEFATPVIQSTITESLENVVLAKSSSQPKSTYEAAVSLTEFELKKILLDNIDREDKDKDEDPPTGSDQRLKRRKTSKDIEPSKGSKSKESKSSSSKGNKSQPKSSECYNAVTNRLDRNNPEGQEYPFDLKKPLPLIEDRGCQVVPVNYFINNDLEYLKGGSSSRKYTTSTTKTKAAKYNDIQGIEDMVPSLWSLVKVHRYKSGTVHKGFNHLVTKVQEMKQAVGLVSEEENDKKELEAHYGLSWQKIFRKLTCRNQFY
ncbi:hypothetical protein Tco_0115483 [Tanacetum coccineum]